MRPRVCVCVCVRNVCAIFLGDPSIWLHIRCDSYCPCLRGSSHVSHVEAVNTGNIGSIRGIPR